MGTSCGPVVCELNEEVDSQHGNSTDTSAPNNGGLEVITEKDLESCRVATNQLQDADLNGNGLAVRTSTKSSWRDPGLPPDGGLTAWTQTILVHLVVFNTWGFINSFGVFQTYYVTALNKQPSVITWIGSVQVFLLFFIGTFTGRLTDAGYFRPVLITGCVLSTCGTFMASLSTQYWQLFLAQGICCGLGNGCLFCPCISLLSTYFRKNKTFAMSIAAAGSGTGGMVFPAMVQQLLPRIGFPWTMRALGFIQLGCYVLCCIGLKTRVPPRKSGALVDWKSFKEPAYRLFAIGMFFTFWGIYFAFYYIGSFARSIIHLPYAGSINLIITLNGIGIVGRIIPGFLADRYFGVINTMVPVVFISSLVTFCWIAVDSEGGLYGWAIVCGFVNGGIQSMFPAALSSLTTNPNMAGTRIGMVFTIVSFAVLTGPPIAGDLVQRKGGGYEYAQIFAGVAILIGGGVLTAARFAKTREWAAKL